MSVEDTARQALENAKSAHKRIDAVEHRQDALAGEIRDVRQLTTAMARVDERVEILDGDVKEIKADVKAINSRPGKMWDKLIAAILGAVGAGLAAALLALILK